MACWAKGRIDSLLAQYFSSNLFISVAQDDKWADAQNEIYEWLNSTDIDKVSSFIFFTTVV